VQHNYTGNLNHVIIKRLLFINILQDHQTFKENKESERKAQDKATEQSIPPFLPS
jgi:hypothetical protein